MNLTVSLMLAAMAAALLGVCAMMQRRRGIDRWSFVPWDYAMILAAIILLVLVAQIALLWRDGG